MDKWYTWNRDTNSVVGPYATSELAREHGDHVVAYIPSGATLISPDGELAPESKELSPAEQIANDLVEIKDPETGKLIKVRAFELEETCLKVNGMPTLEMWIRFGRFLKTAHESIQWCVGDWVNYGESRTDWGEKYTQALDALDYDYGYLRNIASVCGRYKPEDRHFEVTFSHHAETVALPEPARQEILQQVAEQSLSVEDTKVLVAQVTGETIYRKAGTFKGKLEQAAEWLIGQRDARGWDKEVKVVFYEAQKPDKKDVTP